MKGGEGEGAGAMVARALVQNLAAGRKKRKREIDAPRVAAQTEATALSNAFF